MRRRPARQVRRRKRAGRSLRSRRTASAGTTSRTRSRPTMPGLVRALCDQRGVVEVGRRQDALHRPADAQPADQGAGVDPLDADDAVLARGRRRGCRASGSCSACGVSSRTMNPSTCGLRDSRVLGVDAVVADERVGHRDDLALVGRVGEDLLVAGHAGVEDDLAEAFAGCAEARPVKTVPSSRASLAGGCVIELSPGCYVELQIPFTVATRGKRGSARVNEITSVDIGWVPRAACPPVVRQWSLRDLANASPTQA